VRNRPAPIHSRPMNGCVFCGIVAGTMPSETIYQDDVAIAFMDINPAADGHTLVIPRDHFRDIWEISSDVASHVMASAVTVAAMIRTALKPDGINVFQATGAAAFQSVYHFHLHLVPRWFGDPIRLPFVPRPGDRTKIAAVAEQIRTVG